MKSRTAFTVFTLIVMSICSVTSYAQDDPERYQGFVVWEDVVYPSEVEAYESAVKMQMELYAEQDFPHWINVYSTGENIYYWGFEIDTYADIDSLYAEFGKINENAPDKVQAITDAFEGTHESTKSWTCYWDRDLSYVPEASVDSDEPQNFCFWTYVFVKQGKMDEIQDVFKEWVALATEKNAKQPWFTYLIDMGMESPSLFWFSYDKDPADFFGTNAKDMELMGEEAMELVRKQNSHTRKIEMQLGWFREGLSYRPEE